MPKLSTENAKARVLEAIALGVKVEDAMAMVDRTVRTWENWRKNDDDFRNQVDRIRATRREAAQRGVDTSGDLMSLDFATWRKRFLGFDTYPHQQQWIDVLEGREPTPIEGCEWDERNPRRLIVNVPPGHSKTQVVSVDYATYRICMNPNVRIIIVSKRVEQAQKILYQIQQRLTSNRFAELQAAYAPEGGFKPGRGEGTYSQRVMYVAGRTADHKDPTIEALGLGSQIYGSRADLIILDDCVTLSNASEFEKQIQWLESEVESRVKNGSILLVGTRLAAQDLYSELRTDGRYLAGRSPWSYLRQPMVLRYDDDPADWVTLWPKSTTPFDDLDVADENGEYRMWDGPRCAEVRDSKPPAVWSLVYQQQQTADDATFHPVCVRGSVQGGRKPGPLTAGAMHHPARGKQGTWTIASMDPAMSGDCFTVVGAIDTASGRRYIENAWVKTNPSASYFRDHIKSVTLEYGVNEWVIEEQGFQGFLVHDPEINTWLANRGVRLVGHYTGKNKIDPDFGVASLAPLFGQTKRTNEGAGREVFVHGSNLIELPDANQSPGIKLLIEELLTWVPGKRGKQLRQDGPMALWFWETRARVILGTDRPKERTTHMNLPFLTRGEQRKRVRAPFAFPARRIAG